jgi:hypothetical protein
MEPKSIFSSKTVWANLGLSLLGTVLSFLEIHKADSAEVAAAFTILNLVMRFITKQPVKLV